MRLFSVWKPVLIKKTVEIDFFKNNSSFLRIKFKAKLSLMHSTRDCIEKAKTDNVKKRQTSRSRTSLTPLPIWEEQFQGRKI